jgi:hypothetical protein
VPRGDGQLVIVSKLVSLYPALTAHERVRGAKPSFARLPARRSCAIASSPSFAPMSSDLAAGPLDERVSAEGRAVGEAVDRWAVDRRISIARAAASASRCVIATARR